MSKISEAELEVMKILWHKDVATSVEIIDELLKNTKWNRNTIKTLLNRLVNKGIVRIIKSEGKLYRYIPLILENEYRKEANINFIQKFYNGSINNMLLNFVKEDKLSKKDLQDLIKLIESEEK